MRSAFALGLHRPIETDSIFPPAEVIVRRNLWRSLFVLDRFLAASLGRPTAISEDDCCAGSLSAPEKPISAEASIASGGLDAAVRSCQVIGQILRKVYAKRRASTRLASEIAENSKKWMSSLHPDLHSSHASDGTLRPIHGIAILHVNLFYYHSIILLTRPFFLYVFYKIQQGKSAENPPPTIRFSSRMEKFCEVCVEASTKTIDLVQAAFAANYLPQRNPFVLYVASC